MRICLDDWLTDLLFSALFFLLHSPDLLNTLPPEACLGPVDPDTLPPPDATRTEEELRQEAARRELPDVEDFLLIQEFENWAEKVISKRAWGYYRSAADEERSMSQIKQPSSAVNPSEVAP